MELRVLGPLEVVDDQGLAISAGGPKERTLLAVLACHAGKPVSDARLIDAIWADEPPRTAQKTLQAYVSRARKALGEDAIRTANGGYVLTVPLDTARVDRLVAEARRAAATAEHTTAAALLREAESAWRGRSFGDLADEPFALAEAARLDELRLTTTEERVAAELTDGKHVTLVGELEALCGANPYRERLWGQWIVALYRSGRQADALAAYRRLKDTLADELGIDPSPEVRSIEAAILRQDPSLERSATASGKRTLPTGVVTFLLTDVEGSTPMWDADQRAMAAAIDRHDELVHEIVGRHDGHLLRHKGEGDSTLSVFQRASDAATSAHELQHAFACEPWPTGTPISVRMAIHSGEAHERDGDYFGPTVNRAARVRSLANGGQVFVTEASAALLRDHLPDGATLAEIGHRELRGLTRGELVFTLSAATATETPSDEPDARDAPTSTPPIPAAITTAGAFVGRQPQMVELLDAWGRAVRDGRGAVVIGGEPGIGKTTLVSRLAASVHASGGAVMFGRCDEDVGAPFQPFAEALKTYIWSVPAHQVRAHGGNQIGELGRIIAGLEEKIPGSPSPTTADPETERYLLFEAITTFVNATSIEMPVLLVLDDLHWASKPTILLLRHLLRSTAPRRLLVVGTYRDREVSGTPLADLLADARRDGTIERITLGGLDEEAVASFVEEAAGHDLDDRARELAHALHVETEGNPFFIGEVLAHLAESGAIFQEDGRWTSAVAVSEMGLPDGVREVVRRRLARLSDQANDLLNVASVVGHSFTLDVAERVLSGRDLLDPIEEVLASGLISELTPGRYEFTHALVRRTLYDDLSAIRRRRTHKLVAEALEDANRTDLQTIARHMLAAGNEFEVEDVAVAALLAAAEAIDALGAESAIAMIDLALGLLDGEPDAHHRVRCELYCELAVARRAGGDHAGSVEAVVRAADEARAAGDIELLAEAAGVLDVTYRQAEPELWRMTEEALAAVGDEPTMLRARLLIDGASLRTWAFGDRQSATPMAAEALDIARRLDDPALVSAAMFANAAVLRGTGRVAEELSLMEEATAIAHSSDASSTRAHRASTRRPRRRSADRRFATAIRGSGVALRRAYTDSQRGFGANAGLAGMAAGQLGHRDRFDELITEFGAGPTLYRERELYASVAAILDGRFAEAEAVALDVFTDCPYNATRLVAGSQLLWINRERGEQEAVHGLLQSAIPENPGIVALRAGLAFIAADLGFVDEARSTIDGLMTDDFGSVPDDVGWPSTICSLADAAATIGYISVAEALAEKIRPFSGLLVCFPSFVAFIGAADRYLAMMLTLLERYEEAEPLFGTALDLEERMKAPPLVARTKFWYSRMLLQRRETGDEDRAHVVLGEMREIAERLGMAGLLRQADALVNERV